MTSFFKYILLMVLLAVLQKVVYAASPVAMQVTIGAVTSTLATPTCVLVTTNHGFISCLDQTSGSPMWRQKLGDDGNGVLAHVLTSDSVLTASVRNEQILISKIFLDSGLIDWEMPVDVVKSSTFKINSQLDIASGLWYLVVNHQNIVEVDLNRRTSHIIQPTASKNMFIKGLGIGSNDKISAFGCFIDSSDKCEHNFLLPLDGKTQYAMKDIQLPLVNNAQEPVQLQFFHSKTLSGLFSRIVKTSEDGNEITALVNYLLVGEGKVRSISQQFDLTPYKERTVEYKSYVVNHFVHIVLVVKHTEGISMIHHEIDLVVGKTVEQESASCQDCTFLVTTELSKANADVVKSLKIVKSPLLGDVSLEVSDVSILNKDKEHYLVSYFNGLTFLLDNTQQNVAWHRFDGLSNLRQTVSLGISTEAGVSTKSSNLLDSFTNIMTNDNAVAITPAIIGMAYHGDDKEMFKSGVSWCQMSLSLVTAKLDPSLKQTVDSIREYSLKPDSKGSCPIVRSVKVLPRTALENHEGGKQWDSVFIVVDTFDKGAFFYDVALFRDNISPKIISFEKVGTRNSYALHNVLPISYRSDLGRIISITSESLKNGRRQKAVIGARILSEKNENYFMFDVSFTEELNTESDKHSTKNHVFTNTTSGSLVIFKGGASLIEESLIGHFKTRSSVALPTSSVHFDPEEEVIVSVTNYHHEDEVLNRASATGDDNVLLKYSNPQLLVVNTVSRSNNQGSNSENQDSKLFVNLIDSVSGKLLQRIVHENAEGAISSIIIENFVIVGYWNAKVKRTEISVIGLYDGIIGKYDFTPLSSKSSQARKEYDSSVEENGERVIYKSGFATSIPLSIQKTFTIPGKISKFGQTSSLRSITNKNLIMLLDSGHVFSIDLRMIHPRRPISDPTPAEKEEGLSRYHPILPLSPFSSVTRNMTIMHEYSQILSVPSSYESKCFLLVCGYKSDLFIGTVTPSNGFDTLAADFNHPALLALLGGLAVAVLVLRSIHLRSSLKRIWV